MTHENKLIDANMQGSVEADLLAHAAPRHADAPVYFLHVPKTAGTGITQYLHSLYLDDEIAGPDWLELLQLPPPKLAQRKVISGHFGTYLDQRLAGPLRYFTFLRDPLQRAISHYRHIVRDAHHYLHAVAKELGTFAGFMRDPRCQPVIANFQLRQLVGGLDPFSRAAMLDDRQLQARALEQHLDTSPLPTSPEQQLLTARRRLAQFCLVGITERHDDSMALLAETFGWPRPPMTGKVNADPEPLSLQDVEPDDLELLTALNAAELTLYREAVERFQLDWERSKLVFPHLHAFVSYAQNAEDVVLHRALGDVGQGRYIDVGANDPDGDSVTRAFYERGWRGLNIEPVGELHARLQARRPLDINENVGAGRAEATLPFYEIPGTGLSTFDAAVAEEHRRLGFEVIEQQAQLTTLDNLLERYSLPEIHFLKIDVEGWEADVLAGLDLARHRPWIILVEATAPNTDRPVHEVWEPALLARGYAKALFDGLNRFYVADEHRNLLTRLQASANSLDRYMRADVKSALDELRSLRWTYRRQSAWVARNEEHMRSLQHWAESADAYGRSLADERTRLESALAAERESHGRAVAALDRQLADLSVDMAAAHDELRKQRERHSSEVQALHAEHARLLHDNAQLTARLASSAPARRPDAVTGEPGDASAVAAELLIRAQALQARLTVTEAARAEALQACQVTENALRAQRDAADRRAEADDRRWQEVVEKLARFEIEVRTLRRRAQDQQLALASQRATAQAELEAAQEESRQATATCRQLETAAARAAEESAERIATLERDLARAQVDIAASLQACRTAEAHRAQAEAELAAMALASQQRQKADASRIVALEARRDAEAATLAKQAAQVESLQKALAQEIERRTGAEQLNDATQRDHEQWAARLSRHWAVRLLVPSALKYPMKRRSRTP